MSMQNVFFRLIYLGLALYMTACSTIGKKAYGYKELRSNDSMTSEQWLNRFERFHLKQTGFLDSDYVKEMMKISVNPIYRKAMSQFIVALSFDSGSCRSITSNCYFGGFPNLNWDNGTFDKFPFISAVSDSICQRIKLSGLLNLAESSISDAEHISRCIVILSGNTLLRQSTRLVRLLKSKHPGEHIIMLNNDDAL